jgi:hypothetical protein
MKRKSANIIGILLGLFFCIATIGSTMGATARNEHEPQSAVADMSHRSETTRAIYLTANTIASNHFPELIETLVESGGNAVVMDVESGGGQLAFEPENEFLRSINPGSDMINNFKEIIRYLHKKGIYAIARQVVFNDPYISQRRPDWRISYKWWDGLYDYRWLDPSKPGVQYYNLMIMEEVAKLGFDEIQFDYIRFPAADHSTLDYAYDEEKFETHDVINYFLERARIVADRYDVALSVDTFGGIVWGDVDWRIVGQKVEDMAKIVDVIYPMTYPSHYNSGFYGYYNMYWEPYDIVHDTIIRFVEKAAGNAEIRPYIQGFPLRAYNFGEKYIADQIQAGYDAGATGFTIWSPGNTYTHAWNTLGMIPAIATNE